jgi:hypothetical protein
MSEFERVFQWILVDTMAMTGAWMAFNGVRHLVRRPAELQWPTTEGFIHESRLEQHKGFRPYIRYSYGFNGQKFESTQVSRMSDDRRGTSEARAERTRRRFPYGPVIVHVNPDDPSDAYLEAQEGPGDAFLHLAIGIAFVLGAAVFALQLL